VALGQPRALIEALFGILVFAKFEGATIVVPGGPARARAQRKVIGRP
jgi:hypothetical protein